MARLVAKAVKSVSAKVAGVVTAAAKTISKTASSIAKTAGKTLATAAANVKKSATSVVGAVKSAAVTVSANVGNAVKNVRDAVVGYVSGAGVSVVKNLVLDPSVDIRYAAENIGEVFGLEKKGTAQHNYVQSKSEEQNIENNIESHTSNKTTFRAGKITGDVAGVAAGATEAVAGVGFTTVGIVAAPETAGASLAVSAAGVGVAAVGVVTTVQSAANLYSDINEIKESSSSSSSSGSASKTVGNDDKKIYSANGDPELRATRRPTYDSWVKDGVEVDGKTFKMNEHAENSLFKSGRKDIMPDDIKDALATKPQPAKNGSVEYINPTTKTSVFVNSDTDEIVGIWPSNFGR